MVEIEIVYAEPHRSITKAYSLPTGARVSDAVAQAAADGDFAGIDLLHSSIGIFGKLTPADHPLKDGDRVEIYRPLARDPKLARQARAARTARTHGSPRVR
jgi:putative ubiquitin-RnfH superfamily antitoxin RatB of RatAB toxin-antitoxin module